VIRPDLKKLDNDVFSPLPFIRDAQANSYLEQKLSALQQSNLNANALAPDAMAPSLELIESARSLLSLPPSAASVADNYITAQPVPWQPWHRLALDLQEDLVLMQQTSRGFFPSWLHVCFPSGWDPSSKTGADLSLVHAPVAQNQALLAGTKGIANVMVSKGPFVRYVWTLSTSSQLSQHPLIKLGQATVAPPEQLYYRCERQVSLPLSAWSSALFLIRVFVAPLPAVVNNLARCKLMAQSLRSMSQEVLQYKGIEPITAPTIEWLERKANEFSD
jgi:Protein of unknown function (DUF3445)